MAFTSNLAAINAANATLKAFFAAQAPSKDQLKMLRNEHFSIEKHDGEWHAMQIKPFPIPQAPRDPAASLADEREGAFAFTTSEEVAARASLMQSISAGFRSDPVLDAAQAAADQLANEQALADSQSQATGNSPKVWIHSSSVAKPTKLVWIIADEMLAHAAANQLPVPSRKEVQDECIRRGVASGTARTQYQAWKTARDNALKNAEHAAALSAAFNRKPQA